MGRIASPSLVVIASLATSLMATTLAAPARAADPPRYSPKAGADPTPIPPPAQNGSSAQPAGSAPPAPTATLPTDAPTSTSGSGLLPLGSSQPQTQVAPPLVPASAADATHEADQDAREKTLKTRLEQAEAKLGALENKVGWLRYFNIRGYLQPQILIQSYNDRASPNVNASGQLPLGVSANDVTAKADGTTTNGTYFRLRRARLVTEVTPTEHARVIVEIDPNLSGGPSKGTGTIARNIEAAGNYNITPDIFAEVSAGIFKLPFGAEVPQTDSERPFIERSWGEQNMFPSEFDTGARVRVLALDSHLQAHAAVVNGVTIGEKNFAVVPDLNHGKDVLGRVNYDFGPVDVGMSAYAGTGQNVDATNLRFKQFPRWAVNWETAVHWIFLPSVGKTKLFAELTIAQNMDRGVNYGFAVPQIPAVISSNAQCGGAANTFCDERSFFVRIEQDITQWATAGVRFDTYSPDTAQGSNSRSTFSFVGVFHATKMLQFMAEYDYAEDDIHRPGALAAGKVINIGSGVLQGKF